MGCKPSASNGPIHPPTVAEASIRATTCAGVGDVRPLLIEWPAADRAQLEAAAGQGLVAVRYDGCALRVLSRCELEGGYDFHGTTHKRDELRIRDRDALWAEIPLGAARLEGALSRQGQLNVDMMVVGQREANVDVARAIGSSAACGGATHVVTSMTVGAFALYAGAAMNANASAGVYGAGAGAKVSRETETLRSDGDLATCEDSGRDAQAPPSQCGALLRVELAPLGRSGSLVSEDDLRKTDEASKLRRSADRWRGVQQGGRIGAGVTAVGALASLVFVAVRTSQISSADFDLNREASVADTSNPLFSAAERARAAENAEQIESDISGYKRSRRTAAYVGLGLGIGAVALLGLAAGSGVRSRKLRLRAKQLSATPAAGPGFAGVRFSGRF